MRNRTRSNLLAAAAIAIIGVLIVRSIVRSDERNTARSLDTLNPARIAYLEKAGWEAYYARNWGRVLALMVQLNRTEFQMPWPVAAAAAWDTVAAARAFAPVDNDTVEAERHLERYFGKARRYTALKADAATLAALEIDYWIVHRELAGRRQEGLDDGATEPLATELLAIEPMVDALTKLHAALFGLAEEAARPSAQLRARAAVAVDRITGGYSTDVAADWQQVEVLLRRSYEEVNRAREDDAGTSVVAE